MNKDMVAFRRFLGKVIGQDRLDELGRDPDDARIEELERRVRAMKRSLRKAGKQAKSAAGHDGKQTDS
jgi:hypothetical protein